jgi:heterodisulfide reductase subunit A
MVAVAQHPNITLMTYCQVEKIEGFVGNFKVLIRQKAKYIDHQRCTGCGLCWESCPSHVPNEYDLGLSLRKSIYIRFPQAVPNKPVIDWEHCRHLNEGSCGICQEVCPTDAIDYHQEDEILEKEFGAIVLATGYDLYAGEAAPAEYLYGSHPNVLSGLQFERLLSATGPTGGEIICPSNGKEAQRIVFIQCTGSRDEAKGKSYCSRVCCMATAKQAHQVLEKNGGAEVYVFYIDIRAPGKAYEEFYRRSVQEGAVYLRGRVARIYPRGDSLLVYGEDTLLGRQVQVDADLVVLATAMVPAAGWEEMSLLTGVGTDKDGFFAEAHPKLRPVESFTSGLYLAGTCQGPKDIPDSVAQGSGAAAKVLALFSIDEMELDPITATVDEGTCSGCGSCLLVCSYGAITLEQIQEEERGTTAYSQVARVNEAVCQGCGSCTVSCRPGAMNLKGFTNEGMLAEVDALWL